MRLWSTLETRSTRPIAVICFYFQKVSYGWRKIYISRTRLRLSECMLQCSGSWRTNNKEHTPLLLIWHHVWVPDNFILYCVYVHTYIYMYISAPDNRAIVEYQVKEYETNAEYQVRLLWDECFLGLDECFANLCDMHRYLPENAPSAIDLCATAFLSLYWQPSLLNKYGNWSIAHHSPCDGGTDVRRGCR